MNRPTGAQCVDSFDAVKAVGLTLPGVEATTRYDGAPVLKVGGCFMAMLSTHASAESGTLIVRSGFEERACLIEDAPNTYYVTEYHRKHPVVLVRLSRLHPDALRDLLTMSWRLTLAKTGARRRARRDGAGR